MSAILAIDPGTTQSGWCLYDRTARNVVDSGIDANHSVLTRLSIPRAGLNAYLAIEQFEPRGMAVGLDSLETVYWSGRFAQAWDDDSTLHRVFRRTVKLHICGQTKAKDANVRAALIDLLGPQGTKAEPGPTYGVKSHAWAALAVAVTVHDALRVVGVDHAS